jgi:hypothetical protein
MVTGERGTIALSKGIAQEASPRYGTEVEPWSSKADHDSTSKGPVAGSVTERDDGNALEKLKH